MVVLLRVKDGRPSSLALKEDRVVFFGLGGTAPPPPARMTAGLSGDEALPLTPPSLLLLPLRSARAGMRTRPEGLLLRLPMRASWLSRRRCSTDDCWLSLLC